MAGDQPLEWATFSLRRGGVVVAGGSGPWPEIEATARHYALAYEKDGPVKLTIRRRKIKEATDASR